MTVIELVWDKAPADYRLNPSHEKASFNNFASVLWNQQFCVVKADSSTRPEINRGFPELKTVNSFTSSSGFTLSESFHVSKAILEGVQAENYRILLKGLLPHFFLGLCH